MSVAVPFTTNSTTTDTTLFLNAGSVKSYPKTGSIWYDSISEGNNATLTNGAYYTASYSEFVVLDGINDYVNFSSSVYPVSNLNFTIEALVAVHTASNSFQRIVTKGHYGYSPGYMLQKYNSNDGKIRFACGIGSATSTQASAIYCYTSRSFEVGQDVILSFVSTGTYMYLYIDGEKANLIKVAGTAGVLENNTDLNYSASISGLSVATSDKFTVGAYINSNSSIFAEYFNGRISTVRVYNKGFNNSEFTSRYSPIKDRNRAPSTAFNITPAWSGSTYWDPTFMGPLVLDTSGSWVITPIRNTVVRKVKMWGGGGSAYNIINGSYTTQPCAGGAGGFSSGSVIFEGGVSYKIVTSMNGTTSIFSGGSLSGIFYTDALPTSQSQAVIIAGGGGAGCYLMNNGFSNGSGQYGGMGGGENGINGTAAVPANCGAGGTQFGGGANGAGGGDAGRALVGGFVADGSKQAAGGAGYFGGGSGGASGYGVSGGGGSGYIHPTRVINGFTTGSSNGGSSMNNPPNNTDPDRGRSTTGNGALWQSIVGYTGTTGSIGYMGRVVIL